VANSITEMLAPQVTEQDATMVDVYGLKSKAADDLIQNMGDWGNIVGTIGTQPEPLISEQELMDIAIGSAFPGVGVGASVTGGRIAKISEDLWQARGQKLLAKAARNLGRGTKEIRTIDASGKVVKGRVSKTDLDYVKEKIPWWKELNERGIRFLKGRGEKSFYNKPEEISRAIKPPIVSKKQFKEGISDWPGDENIQDFFYWQDYFTNAIKSGVSSKSLKQKYGKVFTDWQANPKENLFESHARRVKIAKGEAEGLLRKQWTKDVEYKNKLAKANLEVKKIQDIYKIADPDKAEFVDTITDLLTRSRN
jgi:hypothetical protein